MRIFYVNVNKKRLVGRCNQPNVLPLQLEYDIVEELSFQFIDDVNQIQDISNLHGLALAIGKQQGKPSYDLLALSKDYTIENNILTFKVNTYTTTWVNEIKKSNTEVYFEISQDFEDNKKVLVRDYCYAWPRVFVEGLSPEVIVDDYYTKEEVDAKIEEAISGLIPPSGEYATEEYVDNAVSGLASETFVNEKVALKQDTITVDNKLAYDLLSGTPTIPTKTSDLQNDSGFITDDALSGYATETYVDGAVSGKQNKITNDNKLDYSLLSSTPTIPVVPTNISDFTNDAGYQTAQDVQDAISGKQDLIDANNKLDYSLLSGTPTVPTKTSDLQNDSGFITDADLSGKQDVIDSNNKLDYALISGAPTVPTSTSQLTNDSDFIDQTALETALSGKQDEITNDNKLGYDLISGAPTVPTSTSQLINDSDFVTSSVMEDALSGKQDVIDYGDPLDAHSVTTELNPWSHGDPEFRVDDAINEVHREALSALSGVNEVSGVLSGKQDAITNDNKLDYSLLSGTPSIPLSTSELTNDSDFQTSTDVANAISGKQDVITSSNKLDYGLLSGTPTIPLSTSELVNDSDFATSGYVDDALSGKQDVIDYMNWLPATSVRMDINHYQSDPDFDVQAAVNMTRDDVYAVSGVVSGLLSSKQDVIDANNKLDYSLLSSTPTIPLSTSQLTNDSDFIDQSALNTALSSKQDVINSNNKLDYALLSGTPNPTNVVVESVMAPIVNFLGKQIQKVDPTDATSGSVTITFSNLNSIPNGCAPTCELHIATNGNISTITLPSETTIINMPETLDYIGGKAITYHVITFRAMKDIESNIHVCANYNYKYEEDYL